MKLVLIEGVGKQPAVQKYCGKGYRVVPTFGHMADLPVRGLGVDINNNFKPEYVVEGDKKKVVANLKKEAEKAEEIIFATDPDREGEAIAWHAANLLGVDFTKPVRIEFNQISHDAVQKGLANPRPINMDLVNAQQARRVLDRLVGYKLTPLLCKKIQSKLSGGRVQSVTLKLVVDRDREIENFKPEEYWTLSVDLTKGGAKEKFKATLVSGSQKKVKTKEDMDKILAELEGQDFVATFVKKSVTTSSPSAPFDTASMNQEAGNKLGLSLKQITATAQTLYEGVEVAGEGKMPLVTYIRTDSVRVAPEAQVMAKEYIEEKFGRDYLPEKQRFYKNKKDAQDAHEAIRPISLKVTPESIKDKVQKNYYRLYKLIYDRFLASQMADAKYNSLSVDIEANGHKFKTTGRALIFEGYTAVYNNQPDKDEDGEDISSKLPAIEKDDTFKMLDKKADQKFTKPPARYTEASLVKEMRDKGIGRPATYSQTVTLLQTRKYLEKQAHALISTELGRVVVDLLTKYFKDIMDVGFTADMEDKLDDIEFGGKEWQKVISDFYGNFDAELKTAFLDGAKSKLPDEESDVVCDKCGSKMVIRTGKFGKFLACPNFPKCRNTKPLEEEQTVIVGKCPKCGKNVKRLKTKAGKFFYGCEGYPDCDFKSWDIPAGEKCPNCNTDMIKKIYSTKQIISCPKCSFSRQEKIVKEKDEKSEN
ncbi:MAG: type I DNA topoisomerase [Clostridia bacterium]|nr:type I DNA topoisomerase [Clostridia bacterium]